MSIGEVGRYRPSLATKTTASIGCSEPLSPAPLHLLHEHAAELGDLLGRIVETDRITSRSSIESPGSLVPFLQTTARIAAITATQNPTHRRTRLKRTMPAAASSVSSGVFGALRRMLPPIVREHEACDPNTVMGEVRQALSL
jgi:hypothetical protein